MPKPLDCWQADYTGVERTFGDDEIIVSKTDPAGRITYANPVFQRVAQFNEDELLGKPHSIVRHRDMPRCVFAYLWQTVAAGREVFAYVVNRCKSGDHYWVFAHVTPSFDAAGRVAGYHSSRRVPGRAALSQIEPIYRELRAVEAQHASPRAQWEASLPVLVGKLEAMGLSYDQLIFELCREEAA